MDFTCKARYIADGATTYTPVGLCYLSSVSRYSAIIAFLLVSLNDLDIFACDISNAYPNVTC